MWCRTLFLCNFLLLIAFVVSAGDYDVKQLRKLFEQSETNEESAEKFYEIMSKYEGNDPVLLAYKAAANAVEAKYSWTPWEKKKHIDRSASLFQKAVDINNDNAEVRFLRYTIELLTPRYLGMSGHVEEDKQFLMRELRKYPNSRVKADTLPLVVNFMLKHEDLSPEERKILMKLRT